MKVILETLLQIGRLVGMLESRQDDIVNGSRRVTA